MHKRTGTQDTQTDQRVAVLQFDGDEGADQGNACTQHEQRRGARPAVLRGLNQGIDQQQQGRSHADGTQHVELRERDLFTARGRDQSQTENEEDKRNRSGREQGRAPSKFRKHAAEHKAERKPHRSENGIECQRLCSGGAFGKGRGDDRHAGRNGEASGYALDEAQGDQARFVTDKSTDDGGKAKGRDRGQKNLSPAQKVGYTTAEEKEAAITEDIGVHHPLQ